MAGWPSSALPHPRRSPLRETTYLDRTDCADSSNRVADMEVLGSDLPMFHRADSYAPASLILATRSSRITYGARKSSVRVARMTPSPLLAPRRRRPVVNDISRHLG